LAITEPSHVPLHSNAEIERAVDATLQKTFLRGINPPIDIDLIAEKQPLIDSLGFLPDLRQFDVDAVLLSKPNGQFDIILDENVYRSRTSFSIAHEIGHIVLHPTLYLGCNNIEASIELSKKIFTKYYRIEREANYFAGAILIPRKAIFKDTEKIYKGIIQGLAGDDFGWEGIIPMLYSALANRYRVSTESMKIRLTQLRIAPRLFDAVSAHLDFISWE